MGCCLVYSPGFVSSVCLTAERTIWQGAFPGNSGDGVNRMCVSWWFETKTAVTATKSRIRSGNYVKPPGGPMCLSEWCAASWKLGTSVSRRRLAELFHRLGGVWSGNCGSVDIEIRTLLLNLPTLFATSFQSFRNEVARGAWRCSYPERIARAASRL